LIQFVKYTCHHSIHLADEIAIIKEEEEEEEEEEEVEELE
jgi:hypothetical protein